MSTPRLQNAYTLRISQQERSCFVCNKFTTAVLTTDSQPPDWFYICRPHLDDQGFCTATGGLPDQPRPSLDAAKRKKEYSPDAKPESNSVVELVSGLGSGIWGSITGAAKKEEEKKEEGKKEEDEKDREEKTKPERSKSPVPSPTASKSPLPAASTSAARIASAPRKYILHRDIFYLRAREFIKKQEKKRASEILQGLSFPAVPKTIPH
ncbi:VPS4-associated protein 1 [Jimgerdemannia flammicorona]|uniref:VPS4-associated protein 1 n=1 Tax=Jimgerdemannia flammicorona TaxID=994334 RepID=A0A433Q1C3_9FUNG|nr:VPS4-associated protein 1 [Jimgerdemannia flammicorona]